MNPPGVERFSLIRFDELSNMINTEFETDNVSCGDNYVVNQAILYLYCTQILIDEIVPGYLHMGFYGPTDPVFDEASATWTMANGIDPWFAPGAISELFVGPFPATDNYTTSMGFLEDSSSAPGWVAIPLPRDVVSRWICDDSGERNKGIRLRLSADFSFQESTATVRFFSSEADQVDLRPLLVVQTEEVDTSGKAAVGSSKKTNWEDMTYEEQMAPLYRFLSSK